MLLTETDKERTLRLLGASTIFETTGEPLGETEWRRWRTEDGWHALTPQAIRDEFDWLFDFSEFGGRVDA